ncbi:MAG: uroporphyrinogen decarboxylase family protein [Tannerellaceae bacterium]|nr:uroporphyrinogen decarboxylase family protein [Tannerellaceae bacterium]MCD8263591.1 uroporphyrinogen decarboxylase family protein [Tannerellaceae bacterium]
MNMTKWMRSIIENKQRVTIPIMTHSGIEMIGKRVVDAVTDGRTHYEAVKILSDTYPSAACSVIMDLTVEAEAFGATVHFPENEVPTVVGRLLSDEAGIQQLKVPGLDAGRIPEYLLANRLAAETIDKPVISGCIGSFSLAGRLYDMSEMMMAIYIDPENSRLLLSKCTGLIIAYCKALKEEGTQGVLIAEPAAGLLSGDACREFSSVYIKQIVEAVQDDSFLVFLHNCGNTGNCTAAMVDTGAAGYHFGNKIDMKEALNGCPADCLVMGNLDPVALFKQATAEEMYKATTDLLEATAGYNNFILSSGCDTPPHIPMENIEAFYNALHNYNKRLDV